MKILIIGYGYVGKAVASIFYKKEVNIIDPKINIKTISDFKNKKFDMIFVCVDTPLNENFKTLDRVLSTLNRDMQGNVVCCKSTALPFYYENAIKRYKNIKIVFSPEYLSHHSNIRDFKSQTFCILGGDKSACRKISSIFLDRLKKLKRIYFTDISTAAFIKYVGNSFFGYKIAFFNEMYVLHKKLNIKSSFNDMKKLLLLDNRIGLSHTEVPGRDGKKGWGGHCLPKDIAEFYKVSKSKLLLNLININKKHRND